MPAAAVHQCPTHRPGAARSDGQATSSGGRDGFIDTTIVPRDSGPNPALIDALQNVFGRSLGIGLVLTEASGNLSDAAGPLDRQTEVLRQIVQITKGMAETNEQVSAQIDRIASEASTTGSGINAVVSRIGQSADQTNALLAHLVTSAADIEVNLAAASSKVEGLRKSSASIQNVAREIQLLAVNAGVEAARHGAAGRGFAVIAEAVKKLADQTRKATEQSEQHLAHLAETMGHVLRRGQENLDAARQSEAHAAALTNAVSQLQSTEGAVAGLIKGVGLLAGPVRQNEDVCAGVLARVASASSDLDVTNSSIQRAAQRFSSLVGVAETINAHILATGIRLPVSELGDICRNGAAAIAEAFESALKAGAITREQLFDTHYRPIPGTNPPQFMTGVTHFADRILPGIQEPILALDARIAFCAAVDGNGYLPTHNRQFSQPPSEDPVWNAAHCRNRRIFNDRTGLASARNTRPLLLQTYRRDMGNGAFVMMHELSAPIFVQGRHWGGFRLGFRHDK